MRRLLPLVALLSAAPAFGGEFNKKLSVGDAAPEWKDLDGTDGKKHSLADLKGTDVVVLVFTCNSCPVAQGYEPRVTAFTKAHAGAGAKVAVVAVNVNTGKADALPAMKERAEKKKLPYPYLYDPTQEIARKYGAMFTPEFVVLDKDRKVAYLGAMDDKAPPGEPKTKHLEEAVNAVLAGKTPAKAETSAAAGCRIKFDKKKDD
jgi:peroxiredoxin